MAELRPRSVVWAVALAGLVAFAGLVAAAVVIVIVAKAAPGVALSDGFYWGSALAAVVLQVGVGALGGRLAVPRLRRAGVGWGRWLYALAAVGPGVVALLGFLRADVPFPVLGTLAPVCAAVAGAAWSVRRETDSPDSS